MPYNKNRLEKFSGLIEKRVDIDAVFASRQELLLLTQASGGHVRQMMQLMFMAVVEAVVETGLVKSQAWWKAIAANP